MSSAPSLPARIGLALPDAITAGTCLAVWVMPRAFSSEVVKSLLMLMLIEFLLIHSGAFTMGILHGDLPRTKRLLAITGLMLLYAIFVVAFAAAFDSNLPLILFGWMLLAKFDLAWRGGSNDDHRGRNSFFWLTGTLAYIACVLLTAILPIPELGLTSAVRDSLQLPGSGLWIEHPQTVVAAGLLYFGTLAWLKFSWQPSWTESMSKQVPDLNKPR